MILSRNLRRCRHFENRFGIYSLKWMYWRRPSQYKKRPRRRSDGTQKPWKGSDHRRHEEEICTADASELLSYGQKQLLLPANMHKPDKYFPFLAQITSVFRENRGVQGYRRIHRWMGWFPICQMTVIRRYIQTEDAITDGPDGSNGWRKLDLPDSCLKRGALLIMQPVKAFLADWKTKCFMDTRG